MHASNCKKKPPELLKIIKNNFIKTTAILSKL